MLTIGGSRVVRKISSWSATVFVYGAFYFGDKPWDNEFNYQVVPWRSSYTYRGSHNGLGIYFGSLSVNNKGCPNCSPTNGYNDKTYLVHWSLSDSSYSTVAGYWEFSNDTATDKVVEARWDGYRSDSEDSELPNLTDIN